MEARRQKEEIWTTGWHQANPLFASVIASCQTFCQGSCSAPEGTRATMKNREQYAAHGEDIPPVGAQHCGAAMRETPHSQKA